MAWSTAAMTAAAGDEVALVEADVDASAPASTATVVVKAARLFDGRGDTLITPGMLIIRGSKIAAVGSSLAVPSGARVVDLGNATLMPGLIDCHTHMTFEYSDNWAKDMIDLLRMPTPEIALHAAQRAGKTLLAGFTTVRDVGVVTAAEYVDVSLRNAIRDGVVPGPRMLVAVRQVGARGGHCDPTGGFPYQRLGPEPGIEHGVAAGPDQFRDAVRYQVKYGADVIKICATGGVLSLADEVDTSQITQEEMNAIVDEAHRLHKKTAVHAHGAEGAKIAIRAGVDSVEHASFMDDEGLRMMKEHGTYLVPTLIAGEYASGRAGRRTFPPEIAAKAEQAIAVRSATFRKAVKMGIRIAFGTDAAVYPHGLNAREFPLLVAHGMTPAAALRSATTVAADLLGLEKVIGSLEAGKEADVIAVPGNPLTDITLMEKVSFVMKGGAIYRNGQ